MCLSDVSTYFSDVGFDKMQNAFCQALSPLITCVYFKGNLTHVFLIRLNLNNQNSVFYKLVDVKKLFESFKENFILKRRSNDLPTVNAFQHQEACIHL